MFTRGDKILASHINNLYIRMDRLETQAMRMAGDNRQFFAPILVELVGEITQDSLTGEWCCSAKRVYVLDCEVDSDGRFLQRRWRQNGSPRRYVVLPNEGPIMVFFPSLGRRENHQYSLRARPSYGVGQRLWAVWVNERWEVIGDYTSFDLEIDCGIVTETVVANDITKVEVRLFGGEWLGNGEIVSAESVAKPYIYIQNDIVTLMTMETGDERSWYIISGPSNSVGVYFDEQPDNTKRQHWARIDNSSIHVLVSTIGVAEHQDTAYFVGDYVHVARHGWGAEVFRCVTPKLDDRIGTIKLWFDNWIPRGWEALNTYNGRYLMIGHLVFMTGGSDQHVHTMGHGHYVLPGTQGNIQMGGNGEISWADSTTDPVVVEPPYVTAKLIQRVE